MLSVCSLFDKRMEREQNTVNRLQEITSRYHFVGTKVSRIYRAHRAVIFAIAQFFLLHLHLLVYRCRLFALSLNRICVVNRAHSHSLAIGLGLYNVLLCWLLQLFEAWLTDQGLHHDDVKFVFVTGSDWDLEKMSVYTVYHRPLIYLRYQWTVRMQFTFNSGNLIFLPCDAMRCTVFGIVILSVCPSVCQSVRLSHSCTVSTWFDLRS